MRRGLVICALSLCSSATAFAQTAGRVVVPPFAGAGSQRFREQTIAALVQLGQQVIPERNIAAATNRLGLRQPSDNYMTLARELNASLFVEGAVTAKKGGSGGKDGLTAQLIAKNNRGVQVGRAVWTAPSAAALQSRVGSGISARLEAILSGDSPSGAARSRNGVARRLRPGQGRNGPALAAEAEADDEADRPVRSNSLDLSIGTQFYTRRFVYNQNLQGQQQGHRSGAVPAPNASLDFFFLPSLGISLGAEYSQALASQDRDGSRHRTTSFGYSAGAKARFDIGGDLLVGAAYGENRLRVTRDGSAAAAPQMPDLSYRQVILGASTRFEIGYGASLIGGGNYLHLLGLGQLQSADYFPRISGRGGEGYAGLAIPITTAFEARVMANLRRYVFAMNNVTGDPRLAGGAVDQYLGVNLAVAYRD